MNARTVKDLLKDSLFLEDARLTLTYNVNILGKTSKDGHYGGYSEENILELLEALTNRVFVKIQHTTYDFATLEKAMDYLFTYTYLVRSVEDNHFYYSYNRIISKENDWDDEKIGADNVQFTPDTFLEVVRTFFPEAVDHEEKTKILEM